MNRQEQGKIEIHTYNSNLIIRYSLSKRSIKQLSGMVKKTLNVTEKITDKTLRVSKKFVEIMYEILKNSVN